jgi:hypothetical protein
MWNRRGRAPSKNASFTLAFALQLKKKHGKTSVRLWKNLSQVKKTSVKDFSEKPVEKIQISLKSDQKNGCEIFFEL